MLLLIFRPEPVLSDSGALLWVARTLTGTNSKCKFVGANGAVAAEMICIIRFFLVPLRPCNTLTYERTKYSIGSHAVVQRRYFGAS